MNFLPCIAELIYALFLNLLFRVLKEAFFLKKDSAYIVL